MGIIYIDIFSKINKSTIDILYETEVQGGDNNTLYGIYIFRKGI